jgi:hypothetical protein
MLNNPASQTLPQGLIIFHLTIIQRLSLVDKENNDEHLPNENRYPVPYHSLESWRITETETIFLCFWYDQE